MEGYLYPDTYRLTRPTTAKEVIRVMVDQLGQVMTQEWQARAKDIHLTAHEVLTLASVIEKETGAGEERPHISSVFHNRLKKHIPLQSDPTVIYGLPNFDGNLHKQDLSHPSPYNTYRWAGLPPGRLPILGHSRSVPPCIPCLPRISISSRRTTERISFPRHSWNITERWKSTRSDSSEKAIVRRL